MNFHSLCVKRVYVCVHFLELAFCIYLLCPNSEARNLWADQSFSNTSRSSVWLVSILFDLGITGTQRKIRMMLGKHSSFYLVDRFGEVG